ncbi:PfkB family carbohydrate kinase [Synechococcus sp. Nb3U1]|uniref:PfkB family carbohydrate kinase n=1 Tax=Synechococcus sp. Nb3U1 TaxID=1914529 RepID=UPI001F349C5D|nr:PfkB family carbohydrate kinase [Synechococcus sp. Nb3U1]MCF2970771.1 PfkB family carbohydrate kinase [Synechococcus sp. Nb3U1]
MTDPVRPLAGPPLILGEVLFDQFPNQAVLGGAPFNVAWNLKGLGSEPIFLSRVGQDAAGEQVLAAMHRQGLSSVALQWDPTHPTGAVHVELDAQGIPAYKILANQAYDHIRLDAGQLCALKPSLLYRGSLAARTEAAHPQIQAFIQTLNCPVFLDLNLRDPWWNSDRIREMIRSCDWLKLNQEELAQVARLEGIPAEDPFAQAKTLRESLNLKSVFLTLGAAGAMLITSTHLQRADPVPVPQMVDTVGAGDAFSAVVILGLLQGWPEVSLLERAVRFAAALCGIPGGTPQDPEFYAPFRKEWGY